MEDFQEFEMILNDTEIDFSQLLAQSCSSPWSFDEEGSENTASIGGVSIFRFLSSGDSSSKPAWLAVAQKSEDTFYVSNLGPEKFGSFTRSEYNSVLQSFLKNVVARIPNQESFVAVLGPAKIEMSVLIGEEAFNLLKLFSSNANRNALHPNDRERFYDFIGLLHREEIDLDEVTFKRWLTDEEKWSDEQASDVQRDFTTCQEVLSHFTFSHNN